MGREDRIVALKVAVVGAVTVVLLVPAGARQGENVIKSFGEIRQWFQEIVASMAKTKQGGATVEQALGDPGLPAGYRPAEDAVPRWWAYCIKRLYDAS